MDNIFSGNFLYIASYCIFYIALFFLTYKDLFEKTSSRILYGGFLALINYGAIRLFLIYKNRFFLWSLLSFHFFIVLILLVLLFFQQNTKNEVSAVSADSFIKSKGDNIIAKKITYFLGAIFIINSIIIAKQAKIIHLQDQEKARKQSGNEEENTSYVENLKDILKDFDEEDEKNSTDIEDDKKELTEEVV